MAVFTGFRTQMTSVNITDCSEGEGQRQQKMTEWESHRQRGRERGAQVSLVTPVGNHTLHPMAPDTHTHTHWDQWYVGKHREGETWDGENWTKKKNNNKKDQKIWTPCSCHVLFLLLRPCLWSFCVTHQHSTYCILTPSNMNLCQWWRRYSDP